MNKTEMPFFVEMMNASVGSLRVALESAVAAL